MLINLLPQNSEKEIERLEMELRVLQLDVEEKAHHINALAAANDRFKEEIEASKRGAKLSLF